MCGIAGVFRPAGGEVCSDAVLAEMQRRMAHRGPDGSGVWRAGDGVAGLAHRRLSIIDVSDAAAQPMFNEAGTVGVVYNGEIYNHAELRRELEATGRYSWRTHHSDTEVLLHAFEEWGVDCVHRFYGMFVFAIVDRRNPAAPRLHIVRDRAGVKPVYFSRTGGGEWVFASEIRSLLAHPDIGAEMEPVAFWHYLTFIVSPAPLTMFKGIFKLPAGHMMTVETDGTATAKQYWDCRPAKDDLFRTAELSEDEAAAELLRLMRKSVERRMVSDVPFGVLLSGGVDSSLTVALMDEMMDGPVSTFTIGYERYGELNEFEHAERIARRYRTDHHTARISGDDAKNFLGRLVELQDEPIADNVCIPLYFLSKLVRESGTTVVQVGEGADENFLGYWWCDHYANKHRDVYEPLRRGVDPLGDNPTQEDMDIRERARAGQELFWGGAVCWWGGLRNQLTPDPSAFLGAVDCPVEGLLPPAFCEPDSHNVVAAYLGGLGADLAHPDVLQKIPYMEMKLRLPEHLLMRVDKMTMANSIEARVPFLDHDVVEFARLLPPEYKLRDGVGKKVLKKASEPFVDHDLLYRRKQGFGAPMDQWLKEPDFGRRCLRALESSELMRQGFIDEEYFHGLLRHQMGPGGGYGFHIWTVMNAVLWHAHWIEGRRDVF